METQIKYLGRKCGLGNRIEQIILLEAYSKLVDKKITYCWNKEYGKKDRDVVSARIKSNNIDIVDSYTNEGFINEKFPIIYTLPFQGEEKRLAAMQLFPNFDIQIPADTIAVHVRGTDRIGGGHVHQMGDITEYNYYFDSAVNKILELKPKNCFVCGDSQQEVDKFCSKISDTINIVEPICDPSIEDQWKDFFAISKCDGVVLATKFSTFSACAAMIGGIPIWVRFVDHKQIQDRYPNEWRIY